MRFIRKGGRVIPIRDGNDKGSAQKQGIAQGRHGTQLALGAAATGAVSASAISASKLARAGKGAAATARAMGGRKFATGIGLAGSALALVGGAQAANRNPKDKYSGLKEVVGQEGSRIVGAFGAAGAIMGALALRKPAIKGLMAVRKQTKKVAEIRKFRNAKSVVSEPLRKLLTRK